MLTSSRGCHSRRLSTTAAVLAAPPLSTMTPYTSSGLAACSPRPHRSPGIICLGGLVPHPDSAVLGGLPVTSTDFRDFRAHGPRMRIDDLSAPTGRFVARVSSFVGTSDDRPGRAIFWPAADATLTPVFAMPSEATPPDLPPRAPTPPPEASVALPPTGRISARMRRRTTAAAGAAQSAVDYGFGPGRVPRTSPSRVHPPPRVSRPRLSLAAAPSASGAPTPVPTVSMPSDRDRTEPLGLPPSRLSTPLESPSVPTAVLDALGAAAELRLDDSAARYWHVDWEREQLAEPTRYASIQYILLGRPLASPTEVLTRFPSHQRPPFSGIQELAGKGHLILYYDEDSALRVRSPTPAHYSLRPAGRAACLLGDELLPIFVPLLMRSWIMQACYSTASCHLGTARTLGMLERFY